MVTRSVGSLALGVTGLGCGGMEFVTQINNGVLISQRNPYRPDLVQEAWLMFDSGGVTIVTDAHQRGAPYNAIALSAAELRQIADMIEAREKD